MSLQLPRMHVGELRFVSEELSGASGNLKSFKGGCKDEAVYKKNACRKMRIDVRAGDWIF